MGERVAVNGTQTPTQHQHSPPLAAWHTEHLQLYMYIIHIHVYTYVLQYIYGAPGWRPPSSHSVALVTFSEVHVHAW